MILSFFKLLFIALNFYIRTNLIKCIVLIAKTKSTIYLKVYRRNYVLRSKCRRHKIHENGVGVTISQKIILNIIYAHTLCYQHQTVGNFMNQSDLVCNIFKYYTNKKILVHYMCIFLFCMHYAIQLNKRSCSIFYRHYHRQI